MQPNSSVLTIKASATGSSSIACTNPAANAACAPRGLPKLIISNAFTSPTSLGRRCVPPAPGITPRVTSGRPICAAGAMIRIRQAIAISAPPPRATPLIAAIQGTKLSSMAFTTSGKCGSSGARSNSRASAPAAKARPFPLKITRVSLSFSAQWTASSKP